MNSLEQRLTFGDLIENVYSAYGKPRAKGIFAPLLQAHLVGFPGPHHRYILSRGNNKP